MIVKCVTLESPDSVYDTGLVTIGRKYSVIEVSMDYLRIIDDYGAPALFSIDHFEMVNDQIPEDWEVTISKQFEVDWGPPQFKRPGFWEELFDGDSEALSTYNARQAAFGMPPFFQGRGNQVRPVREVNAIKTDLLLPGPNVNSEKVCAVLEKLAQEPGRTEQENAALQIGALATLFVMMENRSDAFARFVASAGNELSEDERGRLRKYLGG